MIKLINYKGNKEGKVIYLAKSAIGEMRRNDEEGITYIWSNNLQPIEYVVKETPEEILAMPDIEEANKVIDWEQRRFEVSSNVINRLISAPYFLAAAKDNPIESLVSISIRVADALIDVLKKGQDND